MPRTSAGSRRRRAARGAIFWAGAAAGVFGLVAACGSSNAPDDARPMEGGASSSTSTGDSAGSSASVRDSGADGDARPGDGDVAADSGKTESMDATGSDAGDAATDATVEDAATDAGARDAGEASTGDAGLDAEMDAEANDGDARSSLPPDADTANGECSIDGTHPAVLEQTGLYSDWASRTVASAVFEYTPGLTLWSDGAEKRRFLLLPSGSTITTDQMDGWIFPTGTKVWKEFSVPVEDGGTYELAETRFLCKQSNGEWFRTTYAWSLDGGAAPELTTGLTGWNGTTYEIPSQRECNECHDGAVDGVLGFEAISLAAPGTTPTLATLTSEHIFTTDPDPSALAVPGNAVESAALGWIHANCGNSCHNDTGVNPMAMETGLLMRLTTSTIASAQSTDTYTTAVGIPSQYQPPGATYTYDRIAPGDAAHSVVSIRVDSRNAQVQMPPIDTHVVPVEAGAALETWIDDMPPPADE